MASIGTTEIGLPLASFTESSGFSVCSYPSGALACSDPQWPNLNFAVA
jgi:hypothetical protein